MESNLLTPRPQPEFDEYGLLLDFDSWSEPLAQTTADELGIGTLTEGHWRVIRVLRDFHQRNHRLPPMHRVCHAAGIERAVINQLFGYCLNAWRVAGLPFPGEEATSYLSNM